MTLGEAKRIVQKVYPGAFPFDTSGYGGGWSICNGTRTRHGNIRIPGVGWHETIELAWTAAVGAIESQREARRS